MKKRVEIVEVENGYQVEVRIPKKSDDEGMDEMYPEMEYKEYIAEDLDEAIEIVKKKFNKK